MTSKTGFTKGSLGIGLDISDNSGIPQQALDISGNIRLTGTFLNGFDKPIGFSSYGAVLTEPKSIKTSQLTDADMDNEPNGDMNLQGSIDVSGGTLKTRTLDLSCSQFATIMANLYINKDTYDDEYAIDLSGDILFYGEHNKLIIKNDIYTEPIRDFSNTYFHTETQSKNIMSITDDDQNFNVNIINRDISLNISGNNSVHVGGNVLIGNTYINNNIIAPINSLLLEGRCTVGRDEPRDVNIDLDINGTMRCDARLKASDIKFKKNVQPILNALDKVGNIRGVYYNLKNTDNLERYIGVIAQEIEPIFPELIKSLQNNIKSVRYDDFIAILVEAIKELTHKLHLLENEIEHL